MDQTKRCRGCGEAKPFSEFDLRSDTGAPRARCRPCRRAYQNARNAVLHPPRERGPARVAGATETLRCTRCGELKPAVEFPPVRRAEEKLQTWCRGCFAEANARNYRPYYERERQRIERRVHDHREEIRRRLIEHLRSHPCVDCGETDIVVLEFDHVGEKIENVSSYANGGRNWELIAAEIAKCEVRCANCHRRKTAERRGAERRAWTEVAASGAAKEKRPVQLLLESTLGSRECRACHVVKALHDFPFRSIAAQTRKWLCLPCQRLASRAWYAANSARHAGNSRSARRRAMQRARDYVTAHLASHPCVDCGSGDIRVLEFDHLRDKLADVSVMVRQGRSVKEIANEIAKCDVRCANCHRRRTCQQAGSYRVRAGDYRVSEAA